MLHFISFLKCILLHSTHSHISTEASKERGADIGKPKSGRKWKRIQQTRASASGKPKSKTAWAQKQKRRRDAKRVKEMEKELVERKKQKKREARERREENARRKLENEMKSAHVQEIVKVDKLKNMSKKQLKHIRRTSVRADGTMELVPVYK